MMATPIYVLIATSGRADLLTQTLDSLAACEKPSGFCKVIVVENGPPGETKRRVQARDSAERVDYMHVEYANKSHALNQALAHIDSGLIIFFDDDVRLHPRILMEYAEAATGWSNGAFFGGSFGIDYEERPPEWLRSLLPLSARGCNLYNAEREWHLYLGFNWAAFADDIREAGGFDPNFGPGSPTGSTGQEANMQERLLSMGSEAIDVPDAMCWHYVPRERSSLFWALRRKYRGGLQSGMLVESETERIMLPQLGRSAASVLKRSALFDWAGLWQAVAATFYWAGVIRGARRSMR